MSALPAPLHRTASQQLVSLGTLPTLPSESERPSSLSSPRSKSLQGYPRRPLAPLAPLSPATGTKRFQRQLPDSPGVVLSDRDRRRAVVALGRSKLISELASVNLSEVAKLLRVLDLESGVKVMSIGEHGDALYIVDTGELSVYTSVSGGSTSDEPTCTLAAGELFGELGALYECTRTATVVTRTLCRLWRLCHADLEKCLQADGVRTRKQHFDMLRQSESLRALDERAVSHLVDVCEIATFAAKRDIISEGEHGDAMYIIKRGQVIVTKHGRPSLLPPGDKLGSAVISGFSPKPRRFSGTTFCRVIGPGGYFGERALLCNDTRSATVHAVSETECLVVQRAQFQRLLGPLHAYLQERLPTDSTSPHDEPRAAPARWRGAPRYEELRVIKPLGVGAFAAVALVEHASSRRLFALKIVHKARLSKPADAAQLLAERDALQAMGSHPCVIQLHATYQDKKSLYLLLEPCLGGDLFSLVRDNGHLPDGHARFYAAVCTLALQRLHAAHYAYRDLKPENVMINAQGFAVVAGLGFAKRLTGGERAFSAVGTLEYMAPEIMRRTGHGFAVDFWSLGVLIFEMLVGRSPFANSCTSEGLADEDTFAMDLMAAILAGWIRWPDAQEPQLSAEAKDLISGLLRVSVSERLGNQKRGIAAILEHAWFDGFDFYALTSRSEASPPYRPELSGPTDTSCFSVESANFAQRLQNDSDAALAAGFDCGLFADW
ncbi:kinase-like domain-containing protein [Pavlovales sp. CCMP2436]|nr:kinase-like domain-containing protein [Pavlovales sp. CCMP2436]